MITALRNGKYVTQNASLFRKVNLRSSQWEEEDSDDDESADYDDVDREENQEENHSQNNVGNEDSVRRYPVRNRKPVHRYIYES